VDDSLFVRGRERHDDLDCVVERLAQREPAGAEEVAQRVPLEKLLDQEMPLVDLLERMDRRDTGMAESGQGLRFALEAGDVVRVAEELIGEHLDRDVAIEPQIPCAIHLSHAAGAEGREDLVGAESVARREQEWSLAGIITSSTPRPRRSSRSGGARTSRRRRSRAWADSPFLPFTRSEKNSRRGVSISGSLRRREG
jgi:hypothetical protein